MRKLKRFAALSLVGMLAASAFVGCSKKDSDDSKNTGNKGGNTTEEVAGLTDDGKLLNIYVWNDEFIGRMADHYPGYQKVDALTGKIGDVDVKFTKVPNEGTAYQDNLDKTLKTNGKNQANAKAEDKIDIFLVEIDYIDKYIKTDYAAPVAELGITDSDISKQYPYTQDVAKDDNGKLKALSWQACPGALIYRADVAKDVFGTDEPDKVQEFVKDWDTFAKSAATLKEKGWNITSSANDTFRVFSNNVTSKWVEDKKINIDENIKKWAEMSKTMVDAKQTDTYDLWGSDWKNGMQMTGNVFCYFGPAWLINFCMDADKEGSVANAKNYRVCKGPQGFFWGGSWIVCCAGSDNKSLVKDIMLKLTTDDAIMEDICKKDSDFVNNTAVNKKLAEGTDFKMDLLNGQNPIGLWSEGVASISLKYLTKYDQGCNEGFQAAMKDWFTGNYKTYDEALAKFYTEISDKYPGIEVPS